MKDFVFMLKRLFPLSLLIFSVDLSLLSFALNCLCLWLTAFCLSVRVQFLLITPYSIVNVFVIFLPNKLLTIYNNNRVRSIRRQVVYLCFYLLSTALFMSNVVLSACLTYYNFQFSITLLLCALIFYYFFNLLFFFINIYSHSLRCMLCVIYTQHISGNAKVTLCFCCLFICHGYLCGVSHLIYRNEKKKNPPPLSKESVAFILYSGWVDGLLVTE